MRARNIVAVKASKKMEACKNFTCFSRYAINFFTMQQLRVPQEMRIDIDFSNKEVPESVSISKNRWQ